MRRGGDCWRDERGKRLRIGQWACREGKSRSTYGVILVHVVPLVVEGLLVQLLQVPVGVAVHLHTVRRRRDAMVRAEDLVGRLGEDGVPAWENCDMPFMP